MSKRAIRSALAAMRRRDPGLAERVDDALSWFAGGHDLAAVSQYDLQSFLWYTLPVKLSDPETQGTGEMTALVAGLAEVFDAAGAGRFAAICRSESTVAVHQAFAQSFDAGWKAYRAAMDASGAEPVDLPGFRWGEIMGMDEAFAFNTVALALDRALAGSMLVPGARGWRTRREELIAEVLDRFSTETDGRTLREAVLAERRGRWAGRARGARLAALRATAAGRPGEPVAVPDDVAAVVEPLGWFLRAVGEGMALTERFNLNRAFVGEAARERGWWPFQGQPRQEADVPALVEVHQLAVDLGAVRRRGRMLLPTKAGRALATDPARAWSALVDHLANLEGIASPALEGVALLLQEHPGGLAESSLFEQLAALLNEAGWQVGDGSRPLTAGDTRWAASSPMRLLRVLGLVQESGKWPDLLVVASPAGLVTLEAVLRARATAPEVWPGRR